MKTIHSEESDDEEADQSNHPIRDERIGRFPNRMKQAIGSEKTRSFGRRSGLSETVIRKYLGGVTFPSLDRLDAIAKAANVNLLWLATGEGPMRPGDAAPAQPAKGSIPGYPEITVEMVFKVTAAIETFFVNQNKDIVSGKFHKLILLICKRLVDKKRNDNSSDPFVNIHESDEFKETVELFEYTKL
ncbi:MAG: helix-turn-helix transcriptional regulator [Magnetococcales bacterium]|nr:helix-turn-helix transcriptional regulator [Magnetococcales bacterium]